MVPTRIALRPGIEQIIKRELGEMWRDLERQNRSTVAAKAPHVL